MCGLVYAHDFTGAPVNNGIMEQFDKQRSRGVKGFGLFDGQEMHMVRAAKEDRILNWLCKYNSNLIMFHHRNPTSTINVKRAAHPFSTKKHFGKTQYILVHNGIIRNAKELKKEHEKLGIEYYSTLQNGTFNDSEALLWDLALFLEGKQDKLKAQGIIAFICMKLNGKKLERLYFGRNTNPLNMHRDKAGLALSSEGPGEAIESDTLYNWNYDLQRLTSRKVVIPTYSWSSNSTSYSNNSGGVRYTPDSGRDEPRWGNTAPVIGSGVSQKLGGRIGGFLSKKGTSFPGSSYDETWDYDEEGNIIEYEHDRETQMMLPVGTRKDSELSDEAVDLVLRSYSPKEDDVEKLSREYLLACAGYFESAYWAIEADIAKLYELPNTARNVKMRMLLEQAMLNIETDPEYTGDGACSNLIHGLWQRKVYGEVELA